LLIATILLAWGQDPASINAIVAELKRVPYDKKPCEAKLAEWVPWREQNWDNQKHMTKSEAALVIQVAELTKQIDKFKSAANHKYKLVERGSGVWRFDEMTGDICLLIGSETLLKNNKDSSANSSY